MPAPVHVPDKVVVHPLVLLSAVDHYNRVASNTKKRVVGVLLGQWVGSTLNVANSFAVPFEEDEKNPSVWFLDHNFVEGLSEMFFKVNVREKVVGWYHSGPKLRKSDLEINELLRRFCPNPVLVIIDVKLKHIGIPTDAYVAVEEIHDDGTATTKTFVHVPSVIEAEEAEEIGVEHLLRDVKDAAVGVLSTRVEGKLNSLRGLQQHLEEIRRYLEKVTTGALPVNHKILYHLQDIFNLLPNVSGATTSRAFSVKTNDQLLVVYLSSLIRAVIALHNLINNKDENLESERRAELGGDKQEEEDKEKAKKKDAAADAPADAADVADAKGKRADAAKKDKPK